MKGRTWRTVRATRIRIPDPRLHWTHLFRLKDGATIACYPAKLCPSCKLKARLAKLAAQEVR